MRPSRGLQKHAVRLQPKGTSLLAVNFQIDMLNREYDMVQEEIREFSKKSVNCRNWTITLWAGSIAFAITPTQGNARSFILLSIIFPLMFWLQDIKWTQLQRIFIYRGKAITDYFSSQKILDDLKLGYIRGIDVGGLRKRLDGELFDDKEYKDFSNFWRVAVFPTKITFYPILMLSSFVIHFYFNFDQVLLVLQSIVSTLSPTEVAGPSCPSLLAVQDSFKACVAKYFSSPP